MLGYLFRSTCLLFSLIFFVGCTDANPQVSSLKLLDGFEFQKSTIVTASLQEVSIQANCSRFIDQIDLSFDNGSTWTSSKDYDSTAQNCTNGLFSISLSSSKSPWNGASFTSGQNINVKFRARSRAGIMIYRDLSIQYTPSSTRRQEILVGASITSGGGLVLKGRARGQNQQVATAAGSNLILRGRIQR